MTRLEEEIFKAQAKVWYSSNAQDTAIAAAEVAKKYIGKALIAGSDFTINQINGEGNFRDACNKWIKENLE